MPGCKAARLPARKSTNDTQYNNWGFGVADVGCGIPAYGANKETIQLEEQVKLLGDQMTRMQQSFDEKLAALQANAEQTADNVKQISAWAQHVDTTLKQQTADSDTCADQISGNSKALREQLEELRSRLDRIAKQLHEYEHDAGNQQHDLCTCRRRQSSGGQHARHLLTRRSA